MRAFIGLGSNLGETASNLSRARILLGRAGARIGARSSLYCTDPIGPVAQPHFLNQVIACTWTGTAEALLRVCLGVEVRMGRVRTLDQGPRIIDLDLLLFGKQVIRRPGVEIPHPRMHLRRFVLVPLVEIAPGATHPILDASIAELLARCPDRGRVEHHPTRRKRRNCTSNRARL